eukprot:CAMPEP_0169270386 /NCGR_PEP_ID=MMETSP1016-20121227/49079_1 /TAXON_ID=342587 /ORGANISM="Karlodinium micrum, Strain CCMP2283" /LENGTH=94 /DNA_ID=CAMNT_0009355707 /DNA_START=381 /DNA_END=662 /DNA_ORIENTATION=-
MERIRCTYYLLAGSRDLGRDEQRWWEKDVLDLECRLLLVQRLPRPLRADYEWRTAGAQQILVGNNWWLRWQDAGMGRREPRSVLADMVVWRRDS